jgi:uncharacterized integral membrane protein
VTVSTNPPERTPSPRVFAVPRTRAAGLWIASVLFALILLLLLVFILQNGQRAEITFFGARANPPIGVALLLAAVFGVLLVAVPGTARILQLRMLARRHAEQVRGHDASGWKPEAEAPPEAAPPPVARDSAASTRRADDEDVSWPPLDPFPGPEPRRHEPEER